MACAFRFGQELSINILIRISSTAVNVMETWRAHGPLANARTESAFLFADAVESALRIIHPVTLRQTVMRARMTVRKGDPLAQR